MLPKMVETSDVITGVQAFNSRYAEMEKVLFCLASAARGELMRGEQSGISEALVWTIKSWWGIQGVEKQVKRIAAESLLTFEWNAQLFESNPNPHGGQFAVRSVESLVQEMKRRGARRREWSLASKTLHWLLPWQIPVYDSFVKRSLGLPVDGDPKRAYGEIVRWEYGVARRLLAEGESWFGDVEPRSPFRAIDKYLWWYGGGDNDTAVVVRDPWRVLREHNIQDC